MTIVLVALRCDIFPFIDTSCCGATFDEDAIDVTSSCALYGKSVVVEVMVVFLFITTSLRPYLLLMLKFEILTGDLCAAIGSRVSFFSVAKHTLPMRSFSV